MNPDEIVIKIGNVKAEKYTGEGSRMISDALKHVKDEKGETIMSAFNNFMGGKIMDSNYSVAVNVAVDGKDIGKPFNLVSFSNSDYESEDIKEMKEVSILSIAIRYNNVPLFIKCMKDPHSELEMTEEDSKRYVGRPYGIEFYPDGTAKALASVGKRYYKGEEI